MGALKSGGKAMKGDEKTLTVDDDGKVFNHYSAKIFFVKLWRPKLLFFQFEIIINALVSSFCFIWIHMLLIYGHYKYFNSLIAGNEGLEGDGEALKGWLLHNTL